MGANAFVLRVDGCDILLDLGATSAKAPGWLAQLARPSLLWISHVHWDHLGALPHVLERFGPLPALATAATVELAPLALASALGLRNKALARAQAMARCLRPMAPRTYYELSDIVRGQKVPSMRLMAFEAGHMLGAAMLLIEIDRPEQPPFRVLYSGDFCTHDQPIVAGASIPRPTADFQVDVFICEGVLSGDGAADVVDYEVEMARLSTACNGHQGPRLVAVAALGESCEITAALAGQGVDLIVHDYLRPLFEVYGRHRPQAFSKPPRFGDARLCRQMLEAHGLVIAAGDQLQPTTMAGELAGELVENPQAQITLTNRVYAQTPAGKLLARQAGQRAQVEHYRLPTHAPRWQIVETVRALSPRKVVLVHGPKSDLYRLRKALAAVVEAGDVVVAINGQSLELG